MEESTANVNDEPEDVNQPDQASELGANYYYLEPTS